MLTKCIRLNCCSTIFRVSLMIALLSGVAVGTARADIRVITFELGSSTVGGNNPGSIYRSLISTMRSATSVPFRNGVGLTDINDTMGVQTVGPSTQRDMILFFLAIECRQRPRANTTPRLIFYS